MSPAGYPAAVQPLAERSRPFLDYLDSFMAGLAPARWADVVSAAGGPQGVAIVAIDLVCGFVKFGPLASPRVDATIPAILRTLASGIDLGVRKIALVQDEHPAEAAEFGQFAPHCVSGTGQAATIPELSDFLATKEINAPILPKNSLSAVWSPAFAAWDRDAQEAGVNTYVLVGDCTDLCVANLAVPLITRANQTGRPISVVLPEDCLATYDLPVHTAQAIGATPHDGDLMHAVFLYYMALSGCRVVSSLR